MSLILTECFLFTSEYIYGLSALMTTVDCTVVDLVLGKSCYYTKENDFPRLVGYPVFKR